MGSHKRLLPIERRQRILARVAEQGSLDYAQLAAEHGVSVMTVRRDVRDLVDQGFLTVTHGGASAYLTRRLDMVENPRTHEHAAQKVRIGASVAGSLPPASTLYLGPGSTTGALVQFLPPDTGLHVVTPSLPIASQLTSRSIRVTCLGGDVLAEELTMTGAMAQVGMERFQVDTAVIGAYGVTRAAGVTEHRDQLAELSRHAIARAERSILVIDRSKIGRVGSYRIGPIEQLDLIVTGPDNGAVLRSEVGDAAPIAVAGSYGEQPIERPTTLTRGA